MAPKTGAAAAPSRKAPSRAASTKKPDSTPPSDNSTTTTKATTKKSAPAAKATNAKATKAKPTTKANSSAKLTKTDASSRPKAKATSIKAPKTGTKTKPATKPNGENPRPRLFSIETTGHADTGTTAETTKALGKRRRELAEIDEEADVGIAKKKPKSTGKENVDPKTKGESDRTLIPFYEQFLNADLMGEAATAKNTAKATGKRRRDESDAEDVAGASTASKAKKAKKETSKPAPKAKPQVAKKGPIINVAPTTRLNVFVFGQGDNGELGLGAALVDTGVKRPRLNQQLLAKDVGIVQVVAGGMHAIALTYDNKIYTWGINDQGTLGRDTTLTDELDEETGLNAKESTATSIDMDIFPQGTVFTSVAAGDNCSFAVTQTGLVYGWGTFRSNEGIFGFTKDILVQRTPMHLPALKNIKSVSCGSNHVLALDKDGKVFAWGSGQHNQLGRRIVERTRTGGLTPREFGLPKKAIKYIACGEHHSFAIDNNDNVYAWGSNNFGQCGIPQGIGEDDALVQTPTISDTLTAAKMTALDGGVHHSIGIAQNGDCLVWGRCDNAQLGVDIGSLADADIVRDANDRIRLAQNPIPVPGFKAVDVAAGSDFSIAVTQDGGAMSWGFGDGFRTGQGTDEDTDEATAMNSKWIREETLSFASAGGQFGILACSPKSDDEEEDEEEGEASGTKTETVKKSAEKTGKKQTEIENTEKAADAGEGPSNTVAAAPAAATTGEDIEMADAA